MENFFSSVNDLVLETLSNFSLIKTSADRGDAESCFKMGMIQLLGVNTKIDFKKSIQYFENQSLVDNQDANLLLGFITECEGDFSSAFKHYAKTVNSEKDSYLDKVIKGRKRIQDYLKKFDLPLSLNTEISSILSDYSKGKASKVGASIKIGAICNDKPTCYEVAKILYESKDYISAIQWLQKGEIELENPLYESINKMFEKSLNNLLHSKEIQTIDLESNSLLSTEDPTPFLNKVKKTCEEASIKSSSEWKNKNKKRIDTIIRIQKEKEEKEYARIEAEEAKKEKRKKLIIKHSIICIVLFIIGVAVNKEGRSSSEFVSGVSMIIGCYFWYFLIKWAWKKMFGKK